jgi:hypothetical protein
MTVALALFFYPIGNAFVILAHPFGSIDYGFPTIIGCILFAVFGLILVNIKPVDWHIEVGSLKVFKVVLVSLLFIIVLWLFYIVKKYGDPAILYAIRGEVPPVDVLYAYYRGQLPLKALFVPLVISLGVGTTIGWQKKKIGNLLFILTCLILLTFITIYEMRHVFIWICLYVILYNLFYINKFIRDMFKFKILLLFVVILILFVLYGNIRTNIDFSLSQEFAKSMGIDKNYVNLPLPLIWMLVYFFGGFARGIVNNHDIVLWNSFIHPKILPGFLQSFLPFEGELPTVNRFSEQNFVIDAWHTYLICFGLVISIILITLLFCSYLLLVFKFHNNIRSGKTIPGWFAAIVIWYSVHLSLLPISDYFIDFAAIMEVIFLIGIFLLTKIHIRPLAEPTGNSHH